MKKYLGLFLVILLAATVCFAASPALEEGNRIQFDIADQETSSSFVIDTVYWTYSTTIDPTGASFTLEDGAGAVVLTGTSSIYFSGLSVPMGGMTVTGLKAEDLTDGSLLYIFGHRR